MKPQGYSRRQEEMAGWAVVIETYQLGDLFYCSISNADPGARFARAEGPTRELAESAAREKAARYLSQTRKFPIA